MSQEIQEAVYKQQEVIKDKQLSVKQDLDQVEPAVIEAQNGTVILVHLFISVFKKKKINLRLFFQSFDVIKPAEPVQQHLDCYVDFVNIFCLHPPIIMPPSLIIKPHPCSPDVDSC